jgi:hypothetical protein
MTGGGGDSLAMAYEDARAGREWAVAFAAIAALAALFCLFWLLNALS